jgi:acyl carrier protein
MTTATDVTMLRIAASVLFGNRFGAEASDGLLADFQSSPHRWAAIIQQTWVFAGGQPPTASAAEVSPESVPARVDSKPLPATPSAPSQGGSGPVVSVPGVAWFEAQADAVGSNSSGSANGDARPKTEPMPGSAVVFDPSVDKIEISVPTSRAELRTRIVDLLSQSSGYPSDVFEDGLDLEVDLGIDSVKQAQTLGKVRAQAGLELAEDFQLRDYPTLGGLVDYLAERLDLVPARN